MYEFATEENQKYKEGRVILERALVTESDGMEDRIYNDRRRLGQILPREIGRN